MKTKLQIKSVFGSLLFEYEKENNTIKDTLEAAKAAGANLSGANLSGANLSGANLSSADLYGANLSGANLRGASLYGANLSSADLYGANLSSADLYGANLYGANLYGASLYGANLSGDKNTDYVIAQTRILPEGDLIVYKKAYTDEGGVIVKLLIPKEAKRSSAFGRKCRAEYADVLEIEGGVTKARSNYDREFTYEVGKRVTPKKPFSDDWQEECASGIHFFITKLEAERY